MLLQLLLRFLSVFKEVPLTRGCCAGIVAFTLSIIFMGLRRIHNIAFLGGFASIAIGVWTLRLLWFYGSDIAEKFHVSSERAVRGEFVVGSSGAPVWRNTDNERRTVNVAGWWVFGYEIGRRKCRWRPNGHTAVTPLWRLDKMIAFPYLDELKVSSDGTDGLDAARERRQLEHLVLSAQGPISSARFDGADSSFGGGDGGGYGYQGGGIDAMFDGRADDPFTFATLFGAAGEALLPAAAPAGARATAQATAPGG